MVGRRKIWLPLWICACALLLFSGKSQAALNWIGNMAPAEGSLTGVAIGGDFTVSVEVGKDNVTDEDGQGAGITCTMRIGEVTEWGGNRRNLGDIPMDYNCDAGDYDKYQVTYSKPAGKYEFTCFCIDTTDQNNPRWLAGEWAMLQVPVTCGGIRSDNASVCGGHGACTAMDTCECADGWQGKNCETPLPVCGGIRSDNESVCSGHGACEATDTCQCDEGWTGQLCASPVPATTTTAPATTTVAPPTSTTTPTTVPDNATTTSVAPVTTTVPVTTSVPAATTTIASTTTPTTVPATTTIQPSTTTTSTGGPACPAGKVLGENDPRLGSLRDFRDSVLAKSTLGRALVRIYYTNAESLNAALDRSPALKSFASKALTGLIGKK